ncbi:hypothetical protein CCACVL1_19575 [Corchorus capsularis]|uniref:Uncharacterized protein n=1 Tax=Corchorus capsularis TaxID=210143 RepID=A0A1R3HG54_COCAP|nr:hypothetical protein CCACVL1_19575 [Corchorus capsularis]
MAGIERLRTLKELNAPNLTNQPLCITFPTIEDKRNIDAASGGSLMNKIVAEAQKLFEEMANSSHPLVMKAKPIYEVSANSYIAALEDKVDATNAQVAKFVNLITTRMEAKACGLCSLEDRATDMCPTLYEEEEVNAIGNAPYVNPYNSGWRPNPLRCGNTNQSRANPFPQGQQNFQPRQILSRPQGESFNSISKLEELISKVASSQVEFQELTKLDLTSGFYN